MRTNLERKGLEVSTREDSQGHMFLVVEGDVGQAEELEHKLLSHYVDVENGEVLTRLDRRQTWGVITAACTMGGLFLFVLALRC